MKQELREYISQSAANTVVEAREERDSSTGVTGKNLYMRGIFIQGGVRNANQRIYPTREIERAVKTINETLEKGYSVGGELSHPADLAINPDRISHMITEMWMDGNNGYGKLKILPTPTGQIVKTLIESGFKLGVSSRGSGNVSESTGEVSDFEIITVDVVTQPSAPGAFPTPVYEHLMNTKGGYRSLHVAKETLGDAKAQKYIKESLINIIKGLK